MLLVNDIEKDFVNRVTTHVADEYFLIDQNEELSYKQFIMKVNHLANWLNSNGIKENCNVPLLIRNPKLFIITVFALWQNGAVPAPLSEKSNNETIKKQNIFLEASFLLTDDIDKLFLENALLLPKNILEESTNGIISNTFFPEKSALMMFTSGTTSEPKCVELSFKNLFASVVLIDSLLNFESKTCWLLSLPFYHIGGFMIFIRAFLTGGKVAIPSEINFEQVQHSIETFHPNVISFVPTQLKWFTDANIEAPLDLEHLFVGGAPISDAILNKAIELNWPITPVYGSTETTAMVAIEDFSYLCHKREICLKQIPGVHISISEKGEVIINSASICKGYYKVKSPEISEGKYITNDLGYFNDDGMLVITGRKDEVIISGGENVNLNEANELIKSIEIVKDVCSVSVPDEYWGERLVSAIVLIDGATANESEIIEMLKRELPNHFVPKDVKILEKLPQNEIGKVNKAEIKKLFLSTLG